MAVTVGRVVLYRLNGDDVMAINRRRTSSASIAERIKKQLWPLGAQAHIGPRVVEGDVLPMVVVRVHHPPERAVQWVNGQVLLDGTDVLWATGVIEGTTPGTWHWPERV